MSTGHLDAPKIFSLTNRIVYTLSLLFTHLFTSTDRNGYKQTSNSKPKFQEPISTPKIDEKKFEHENTDLDFGGETGSGDDDGDDDGTGEDGEEEEEDIDDIGEDIVVGGEGHKNNNGDSTKHKEDEMGGGGRDLLPSIPEIDEEDEDLRTEVEITHENSSNIHLSNTHSKAPYSHCRGTDKQKTNETRCGPRVREHYTCSPHIRQNVIQTGPHHISR